MANKGIPRVETSSLIRKGKLHFFGIAINDYHNWSKLKNAVNDVEAIAHVLEEQYYFEKENIVIYKNEEATRKRIVNKLHSYTEGSLLGSDDSLIICFSGHGYLDNNEDGYWVPIESKEEDIDSYIPNGTIQSKIKGMKCLHVLLISDSCFSGSLISRGDLPSIKSLVAEELSKKKSRFVFTSGGYKESVLDGFGKHSPFAEAILSELRYNTNPLLISDELAFNVRRITHNNAPIQIPQFVPFAVAGDLAGRFVFRLKDGVITPPEPNPPPISPQKLSWFEVIVKFGLLKIAITLFSILAVVFSVYKIKEYYDKKQQELAINKEQQKEKLAWENAQKQNNKQSYDDYLKQYPKGIYMQYAEKAKDSIDKHTNLAILIPPTPTIQQPNNAQIRARENSARLAENERRRIEKLAGEIKEHISTAITYLNANQFEKAK